MEVSNIFLMIPNILFVFLFGFVVVYFSNAIRKVKEEKGLSPKFTVWCFGVLNGFKQPGIRLSIYETFIVISHFRKNVIRGEDIDRIEKETYLTAKGLSIHLRNSTSKSIFLMPRKIDSVFELLKKVASEGCK